MGLGSKSYAFFLKKLFSLWGKTRLPRVRGQLSVSGLRKSVEIFRDSWGIPHIYADNYPDLYFTQGFVHAQERLFQMEMSRLTAHGRLSEIFGELALETDRVARLFGFSRLAEQDFQNLNENLQKELRSYCQGINAYLKHLAFKKPLEFSLLKLKPNLWSELDSLAIGRVMMWQLSHSWYATLVRSWLIEEVGEKAAAEWEIDPPECNPLTLPKGIEFHRIGADGTFQGEKGPFLSRGKGSNAWVLSGKRTVTGKPLLANDVHLSVKLPSIWFENHLVCQNQMEQVTGASLPGLPLVIMGHNDRIGWGITVAYTECEDLFLEKIKWQEKPQYEFQGKWKDLPSITEIIHIKGRENQPHIEEIYFTHHGPLLLDSLKSPKENSSKQAVSVQSKTLEPSSLFRGLYHLNRAKNWDNFVESLRCINAPHLNFLYGDTEGNIGFWVSGKVPIRKKGRGQVPVEGWSGKYEWTNSIPFEDMPHALNPSQGFLLNANQRMVSKDYPYYLGNSWMNGYRAKRIEDVINEIKKFTIKDCCHLQMDCTCLPGLELVDCLKDFSSKSSRVNSLVDVLKTWDGKLKPDTLGGLIYEVCRYTLIRNLLNSGIQGELIYRLMGQGFHPLLMQKNRFYGQDTVSLLRILENPKSFWLKKAGGKEKLLNQSLTETFHFLEKTLGGKIENWQWGKLHQITFAHPLGRKKPLDKIFNCGPYPIGGDSDCPCQTAMAPEDPYANQSYTPTYRQVIDFNNFSNSLAMHAPGQSGNLGSPHYGDMIPPWRKGEYHPMLWQREEIEQKSKNRLLLLPDSRK